MGALNFISKQNNLLILKKLFQGQDGERDGERASRGCVFNLMSTVVLVCFASSHWKLIRIHPPPPHSNFYWCIDICAQFNKVSK